MCTASADDSTAYLAISGGQSRTVVAEEATILLVDIIRVHGSPGHSLECREMCLGQQFRFSTAGSTSCGASTHIDGGVCVGRLGVALVAGEAGCLLREISYGASRSLTGGLSMATILNGWGMVLCTDGGTSYARGFPAAKTLAPAPNYGDGASIYTWVYVAWHLG